jgi:hypothetical protein
MIAHFFVAQIIQAEVLLFAQWLFADYAVFFRTYLGLSRQPHKLTAKPDILLIRRIEITLGQADVVDRIEDIGFAHAIIADEAVHFFRKSEVQLFVILEIGEVDRSEQQCE